PRDGERQLTTASSRRRSRARISRHCNKTAARPPPLMPNVSPLQEHVMRPLRYSINVTLDGCCDHRAIPTDEDLHRHAIENLDQADALLFGRGTYQMMEAAWRR